MADIRDLKTAQRFQLVRQYLGLSRSEWADKLGTTAATIENIEYGKQRLTQDIIESFAFYYPSALYFLLLGSLEDSPVKGCRILTGLKELVDSDKISSNVKHRKFKQELMSSGI